jgi:membrane fusion protein (multidrug efflux system)
VAQARAAVNSAQVNLSFCTITASVSGVIGEIPVRMGDQVSPGTQLTILSGNQNMDAEFSITENLLELMIQNGVKASEIQKHLAELPDVTFVMKNGTTYEHKGRVTRMTGVVNATTGTIAAKATFPNPTGLLYSGIQGTVVIPNDMKDVIVIPQVAVVKLQDRQQVYKVLADSTATAVEVTTEDVYNGKDYIVTSGLKVGDKIVTVGANNVHEGQKVLFPKAPKTQK